jgi:hypothetical protein
VKVWVPDWLRRRLEVRRVDGYRQGFADGMSSAAVQVRGLRSVDGLEYAPARALAGRLEEQADRMMDRE